MIANMINQSAVYLAPFLRKSAYSGFLGFTFKLALLLWIAILLVFPLLVTYVFSPGSLDSRYTLPIAHALVEVFCGLNALMIFGMLIFFGLREKDSAIYLFGFAFLIMGMLDIFHAAVDPGLYLPRFYLLHTFSALSGALLFASGVIIKVYVHRDIDILGHRAHRWAFIVATIIIFVAAAIYNHGLLDQSVAALESEYLFPRMIHNLHALTALLYALCAVAFYIHYASRGALASLVIGSILILFAQSAYLFNFSAMWSVTWWLWHGIKLALYLTCVAAIIFGFMTTLMLVDGSRSKLARMYLRLRKSDRAIRAINSELTIRNEMSVIAVNALGVGGVVDAISSAVRKVVPGARCMFRLVVPVDEMDEFNRFLAPGCRQRIGACIGAGSNLGAVCALTGREGVGHMETGNGDAADEPWSFPLNANGEQIGCLQVDGQGALLRQRKLPSLKALAEQAGPILFNSLLYRAQCEDETFYSDLSRCAFALASTLDVRRIQELASHEGARLLRADGAFCCLYGDSGAIESVVCSPRDLVIDNARLASCGWFRTIIDSYAQGYDEGLCSPSPVFDSGNWKGNFEMPAEGWPDCRTISAFPLFDHKQLVGMVCLFRFDAVRFSKKSLAKGELLMVGVQAAINNGRQYQRLLKINRQLKLTEEARLRSERLAALGEMAASVAHEVRNPLGAISNCLAVLRHANDGRAHVVAEAQDIIQCSVERIDRLTRDFLTFGSHEPVALRPVVMSRLLARVDASLQHYFRHEGFDIRMATRYVGETGPLLLDAERIEGVLWNLVRNSAQASHGVGKVETIVRQKKDKLLLVVKDYGDGMTADIKKKMFEPFFSQREQGAGLGLAIVQRYCQDCSASLRVFSRPGRGTTVAIRIPLSARPDDRFSWWVSRG